MKILKWQLTVDRLQSVALPPDAKILTIQMQHGVPTLWAECPFDPDTAAPVRRRIALYGTGWNIEGEDPGRYIATVQVDGYVWHFYDMGATL